MNHSPGPWRALDVERIVDAGGYLVASISGRINEGSYEANGSLIAAAPELLSVMRELVATLGQAADIIHDAVCLAGPAEPLDKCAECSDAVDILTRGRALLARLESR